MIGLSPVLTDDRAAVLHGDATHLAMFVGENFVDAIVTDPPAGISFMGREWDGDKGGRNAWIAWLRDLLAPSLRALKPGGHALVWALPRTSHWTATALEDAGFEIRDVHHHLFGTGFPKSLNVVKAYVEQYGDAAVDAALAQLDGLGTALKPAVEHWILARKPIVGTYVDNVLAHRTGAMNIDACRIGDTDTRGTTANRSPGWNTKAGAIAGSEIGRWPAHLSLDEFAADMLDEQTGELRSGGMAAGTSRGTNSVYGKSPKGAACDDDITPSRGGASRFFYVAKGTRAEKDTGLEHLEAKTAGETTHRKDGSAGLKSPRAGAGRTSGALNSHPTVKSIALMRWLVRLITPPGGVVLDPFAGSGSTGVAALEEGARFIGCELGTEHIPILVGRIRHALVNTNSKGT